jgi:hypothetical protein
VRLAVLAAVALCLACAVAGAARAGDARPVTSADRALLARPATYEERIAQQVARRLTHINASVRCGSLHGEPSYVLGITPEQAGHAFGYFLMRPAECTYLAWFHDDPARWDPDTCVETDCNDVVAILNALETVSHESYHLLGYANEAQVECYGMQSLWFVASKLGASAAEAEALAHYYATRMYPTRRIESPAYWSPQCRDGGKLDLRPTLTGWPS